MELNAYAANHQKIAYFNRLLERFPVLKECGQSILMAEQLISQAFQAGQKLLVCGNGGSAADAEHLSGELLKSFLKQRRLSDELISKMAVEAGRTAIETDWINRLQGSLPVIVLTTNGAIATAISNDQGADLIFAQQVLGCGASGDVLVCISTSGNSENILKAAIVAKAKGIKVIGLTGLTGGRLISVCDVNINVPVQETYQIQELHLPIYHCLSAMLEEEFFG
ncbi:MAG TPA: SIS domain-containing protein [Bacillota bacterium]|jgi:D-sedoheptulose 7-phosphate isomerase|nr:SIS domain-containing protein [Bacillota bacterium]HOL10449.1 SIS domain-containing protein [Bacillota bacterium]HPO98724.1 SIS domain-containing protein [Bacillota bacterium]